MTHIFTAFKEFIAVTVEGLQSYGDKWRYVKFNARHLSSIVVKTCSVNFVRPKGIKP